VTAARAQNPLSVLILAAPSAERARLESQLKALSGWELSLECVAAPADALQALHEMFRDLVFVEYPIAGCDGLSLLAQFRQLHPKTAVVIVTPGTDEKTAVALMKTGVLDYLRFSDLPAFDVSALARRVVELRYLVDQNMELRQVNQMKNEFIANVSHELRTPLSVIIGYSDSLKTGSLGAVSPSQQHALDSINTRAEQLLRTVNQILRIGEGQQRLMLRPLDLRAVAREAAAQPNRDLARKSMRLELELPPNELWVRADQERLSIVLENLLSNAAKFGPEHSQITLTVRADGQQAVITVKDDGPGIPQEMMPRLFEHFSAAVQGPTREHAGLGLGLPLCKRIVEQHSGRIWLESADRKGCMALVSLPLTQSDSPPLAVADEPGLQKKRVLIVEDNPEIVDVLLLFMSSISQNLELQAARSGFEALERVKDKRPDLIILDVVMPGMDGFEVLDRLRRAPATQAIPVLVLTGYTDAAERAKAHGAQDVLLKPFERKKFVDTILQMLRQDLKSK
jgi:signal transduction histidine kinase